MIESIYDHPQSISEAQFDALISYVGKKLQPWKKNFLKVFGGDELIQAQLKLISLES